MRADSFLSGILFLAGLLWLTTVASTAQPAGAGPDTPPSKITVHFRAPFPRSVTLEYSPTTADLCTGACTRLTTVPDARGRATFAITPRQTTLWSIYVEGAHSIQDFMVIPGDSIDAHEEKRSPFVGPIIGFESWRRGFMEDFDIETDSAYSQQALDDALTRMPKDFLSWADRRRNALNTFIRTESRRHHMDDRRVRHLRSMADLDWWSGATIYLDRTLREGTEQQILAIDQAFLGKMMQIARRAPERFDDIPHYLLLLDDLCMLTVRLEARRRNLGHKQTGSRDGGLAEQLDAAVLALKTLDGQARDIALTSRIARSIDKARRTYPSTRLTGNDPANDPANVPDRILKLLDSVATDRAYPNAAERIIQQWKAIAPGVVAPGFTLPDTTGRQITFPAALNKPTYLVFWRPSEWQPLWTLDVIQDRTSRFADAIQVICVASGAERDVWLNTVRGTALNATHLIDTLRVGNDIRARYDIRRRWVHGESSWLGVLIDRDGRIVVSDADPVDHSTEELIERLIQDGHIK